MISFLLIGFLIGAIFGFLLQKGGVANFNTIVGQFLFRNITVLNIMLSAIIAGGLLVYLLVDFGYLPELPAKLSSLKGSAIGGVVFGLGMAILGYCPGTALAALGQGSVDAVFGILGMFFGVFVFEKMYFLTKIFILNDEPTRITLSQYFGISHYVIFGILLIALIIINILFKKVKKA